AKRGLPGVCLCRYQKEPLEETAVLYDGTNYVHVGACGDHDTWITGFGGNDPDRILDVLKERFGREIIPENDPRFSDDDDYDEEDSPGDGEIAASVGKSAPVNESPQEP